MDFHTIFGSLLHLLATADTAQQCWIGGTLVYLLLLVILHHKWRDDKRMLGRWQLMALLPLAAAAAHLFIYVAPKWEFYGIYSNYYLIVLLTVLPMLLGRWRIGYRITAVTGGLLIALLGIFSLLTAQHFGNYYSKSYTESFRAAVQDMERTYILKEWKETDFAALEAKYLPRIEEAEKEQNSAKFIDAVSDFLLDLHDGHVWAGYPDDYDPSASAYQMHEYGLCLFPLDSGEVIAVNTAEEVQKLGILNGSIITKWNGKPIKQAIREDSRENGSPVQSNEDFLRTVFLSCTGGDTVEVSYLDDDKEKTVTLSDLGTQYSSVGDTMQAFTQSVEIHSLEELHELNFSTKMLDDKCGYLRVLGEETQSTLQDYLGYLAGNHTWAREMFREKLRDLKNQGMEYLVIDLRNNTGGFDEIGCALTDLLTTEEWYGQGLGIRKNGQYICTSDHGIHGDGEFADLKAVALTNFNCASAGDGTSLYLSRLPNVTLAGMTEPCGCNQETGGNIMLADGLVSIFYPTGLILDENCVPNIDTRADRVSRNPVEVHIPVDMNAAMQLFSLGNDYELEWARQFLETQN
ncbi:MAG TPA: hypothetical protein DDX71_01160 [Ruminococcus sp.]|nr:hypothetical protein [Ruminococcus sp.]